MRFVEKLRILGQLSWKRINVENHEDHGYESVNQAKGVLPDHVTPDVPCMVFRLDKKGLGRLIGYRDSDTYYLCAVDCKGKLYKH